ncbi:MAG TPA: DUF4363 family protein [Clostridia bacterium]|jgi:hypothetical protein|nr:DUF4363 family protein [Clostridia bacterium]
MTSAHEFKLANKIAAIAAIVVLLGLFIFSHIYVGNMSREITMYVVKAETDVHAQNWASAEANLQQIDKRFQASGDVLKLFFDHEDVDMLDTEISTALHLVKVQEPAEIFLSLENIKSIATYLAGIESFTFPNLF